MDRPDMRNVAVTEGSSDGTTTTPHDWGDYWVHELIAMTRPGAEINLCVRSMSDRVIPFQFDDFS